MFGSRSELQRFHEYEEIIQLRAENERLRKQIQELKNGQDNTFRVLLGMPKVEYGDSAKKD